VTEAIPHWTILGLLTLCHPASFGYFCTRTTGTHVALCTRNSAAGRGRELFKGSKDVASLLACTQKNIFYWGLWIFCE